MRLLNFRLSSPSNTISLVGLDNEWDLHNLADFQGMAFDCGNSTLTMRWTLDYTRSPWGAPKGYAEKSHLSLVFRNPTVVLVLPGDGSLPLDEDACVAGISKVLPSDVGHPQVAEYRHRKEWREDDPFNLFFVLQSGRSIEIGADAVELKVSGEPSLPHVPDR